MNPVFWQEGVRIVVFSALRTLMDVVAQLGVFDPEWVVLRRRLRGQRDPLHYVFRPDELQRLLREHPELGDRPTQAALELHEHGQSPSFPARARPELLLATPDPAHPTTTRAVALDDTAQPVAVGEIVPLPLAPVGRPALVTYSDDRAGGSDLSAEEIEAIVREADALLDGADLPRVLPAPAEAEPAPARSSEPPKPRHVRARPPATRGLAEGLLSAEAPEQVAVGDDALIDVRAELAEGAKPLRHSTRTRLDPAQKIRAILSLGDGSLEVTGPRVLTLEPPAPGEPATNAFEVRGAAPGPARVAVYFRQGARELGSVSFSLQVVAARTSTALVHARERPEPVTEPVKQMLKLLIMDRRVDDEIRYTYLVDSEVLGLQDAEFSSRPFQTRGAGGAATPLAYVQSIYRRIVERVLVNPSDSRAFARELQAIGTDLCRQLFDDAFVRALWPYRAQIQAIHVTSWEPYIPWELLRLKHPDSDETDARFLGEYGLVRSLSGRRLARQLALRDWAYLVAEYPYGTQPALGGEVRYLTQQLPQRGIQPRAVPPDYDTVLDTFTAADFDVLHIACHGLSDQEQIEDAALLIGDRQTPKGPAPVSLDPSTVREFAQLKARRPLVFLNACESARLGPSLTDWGGWPRTFLEAGAGAFVGTSWAVREKPANAFAEAFYDALLADRPLADAARAGRSAARALGDGSWLAFVVYGQPGARRASL